MTTGVEPPVRWDRRWSERSPLPAGPLFDPPLPVVIPPRPHQPQQVARRQMEALRTGAVKHGNRWTQELVTMLTEELDVDADHTVLAAVSGTAALRLAVVAAAGAARPGEVAILPSYTFTATAEVLLQLGYQLRYVDVDAHTWTLDPAATREACSDGRVRLVVSVDTFGNPCDYSALRSVCSEAGAVLVADSAAALGSLHGGRAVSQLADAHSYSMSFAKVLSAGGAGGCLVAPRLATARLLADPAGWTRSELISELHAVVAVDQLEVLSELVRARRSVAEVYDALIGSRPDVQVQEVRPGDDHSYVHWVMRVRRRDEVQAALAALGVLTKPYFPALHLTSHPSGPDEAATPLPVTEALDAEALALPMSSQLSQSEALRVAEAVTQVLRAVNRAADR